MNKTSKRTLLGAAVAGLLGATLASSQTTPKDTKEKAGPNLPCWGVNKCAAHAHSCMGQGSCAGRNSCKGQGWLPMPKDSCDRIAGGRQSPQKEAKHLDPQLFQNFGSH